MALAAYINSEWFALGCRVIKVFYDMITSPLMELLGIDDFSKVKNKDRNWEGIKDFFELKKSELREMVSREALSSEDKLIQRCASKILENTDRQLNQIVFFRDHLESSTTVQKMKHTPLTNSASESRMAQLDLKMNFSGGAAPVQTLSDKQVISVNQYFTTDEFSDGNTLELFKWASTSKQAKEVNKLQKEYLDKVQSCKVMLVKAKQLFKEKKNLRALGLLAQCRQHGGPLSTDNSDLLHTLSDEEVILEVKYLKATIASDLKLKKRVKDAVTDRYKFIQIPVSDLKTGINSVLYPTNQHTDSVENLLDKLFSVQPQLE